MAKITLCRTQWHRTLVVDVANGLDRHGRALATTISRDRGDCGGACACSTFAHVILDPILGSKKSLRGLTLEEDMLGLCDRALTPPRRV